MRRTTTEPFALLGLAPGATAGEVRRAFRGRVRAAHPDLGGDPAAFRALWAAYRTAATLARPDADTEPAAAAGAGRRSARTPAGYAWCFEPLEPLEPLESLKRPPADVRARAAAPAGRPAPAPASAAAFASVLDRELARVG